MVRQVATWTGRLAAVLLSAAVFAPAGAQAQSQTGDATKVGFLMPLTGGSAKLGQMIMEGATHAVDEINASGGVAGKRLALIPEDSQALAKQGIDGFRKLVDIDRTEIIITGWTAVVVVIAPLAERSKTYLLSASTASPSVRGLSPYFQSSWMFDDETVKLLLPYAKNTLKSQRLAILTPVSDLGTSLAASVRNEWQKNGGALVAEESHQLAETNFRPTLLKLLGNKPDAVYLPNSNGKQLAQIVRQARDLGYKGAFLSLGAFEDPELLTIGDRAEGCYYTPPSYDPAGNDPQTRRFVESFQKRHQRVPNVHQANHYDLIYLYKTAAEGLVKQGKPVTGSELREYFVANLGQYRGASGRYVFNFADGSVRRSSIVKTVKDGKFVKIADLD